MALQETFDLNSGFVPEKHPPIPTHVKLEALATDPLAGFLPTTHEEKSQAFEMLDYLGNSHEYPAGVGNRLQEIFLRQRNMPGGNLNLAKQALISIANEYGDHLRSAVNQSAALETLAKAVDDCPNPFINLLEAVGTDHPGLPLLVRYKDLKELHEKGRVDGIDFDPLHTIVNRTAPTKDKNKTIEDPYTASEKEEEVILHITDTLEPMTIGSVRKLVKDALADQENRRDFWINIVRQTRKHGAAWIAGKRILAELNIAVR